MKLRTCSRKKRNLVFKWNPQTLFCLKRQMNLWNKDKMVLFVLLSMELRMVWGQNGRCNTIYDFFLGGQGGQLPPLTPLPSPLLYIIWKTECLFCLRVHVSDFLLLLFIIIIFYQHRLHCSWDMNSNFKSE